MLDKIGYPVNLRNSIFRKPFSGMPKPQKAIFPKTETLKNENWFMGCQNSEIQGIPNSGLPANLVFSSPTQKKLFCTFFQKKKKTFETSV